MMEVVGEIDTFIASAMHGPAWPVGTIRLQRLANIDTALVVRVSSTMLWLMPHGGQRILQRLAQWLVAIGVRPLVQSNPILSFPEARSPTEALALAAVSRAASPLALDLLFDQHRRWRQHRFHPRESISAIRARSRQLNHLIDPALVVVVGRPNVGKSTLTNALLGREASITSEVQGTTRDYVLTQLDLAGLVVRWCDTPGRYESVDSAERQAIAVSAGLISAADCLISAAAPGIDWPDLPREPDLCVCLKSDLLEFGSDEPTGMADILRISARIGTSLAELVGRVRDFLVPSAALTHPGPWCFDDRISPE